MIIFRNVVLVACSWLALSACTQQPARMESQAGAAPSQAVSRVLIVAIEDRLSESTRQEVFLPAAQLVVKLLGEKGISATIMLAPTDVPNPLADVAATARSERASHVMIYGLGAAAGWVAKRTSRYGATQMPLVTEHGFFFALSDAQTGVPVWRGQMRSVMMDDPPMQLQHLEQELRTHLKQARII